MIRILLSFLGLPVLLPLLAWIDPVIGPSEFHRREEDLRVRIAAPIEMDGLKNKIDELQVRVTVLNESLTESLGQINASGSFPNAE